MSIARLFLETIDKEYYGYNDPVFFEKDSFEWVADLEKNYQMLMKELSPLLDPDFNGLKVYPEDHLQFPPKLWKGYPFYFNGIKIRKNLRQFPLVAHKLAEIPNLISASVSVLEPGGTLLPHNGSTNGVIRVHYPLKVPGSWPECGMHIEGHDISWEEGKIIMFCDMKIHYVRNLTHERRYLLLMDVVRPEFSALKKKICVHTISRILTNIIINIAKKMVGR